MIRHGIVYLILLMASAFIPFMGFAAEDTTESTIQLIDKTLESLPDGPAESLDRLRTAAQAVLDHHSDNVFVKEELASALQSAAEQTPQEQGATLKFALLKAKSILAFQPIREAELPTGFPEPTPVGEIRTKSYPKYRLARTEMKRGQNGAFNVLFNHIKENKIAMTAPVEMTYGDAANKPAAEKSMAFLYRSTQIGNPNQLGNVEVVDIAPMQTVSLGIRGKYDDKLVAKARKYLEHWLEENSQQYEATGELRVMGYNSPFVPSIMRYAEIEIPIKQKQ